jgi:serine/threonine-protein kinase
VLLSSALVLIAIVAFVFANGGKQVTVPDVRDLTTTQATARLKASGLKIKISKVNVAHHKAGDIVGQSPSPGDKIDKGDTVRVTVATGLIAIPSSLVGMTYDDAAARLVRLGLMPARVDASSSKATGTVLSASPNTTAKPGDTVTLTVAAGSLTSNSPDPGKDKPKSKDKPGKGKDKPTKPKPKAPAPTTTPSPDPSTSAPAG